MRCRTRRILDPVTSRPPTIRSKSPPNPSPGGRGASFFPLSPRGRGWGVGALARADYCDPYRFRVIREALSLGDKWSIEQCLALQLDVRSIPWEEMRDIVLSLPADDADMRDGLELLRTWDGRVDAESPAACIFELFLAEMCVRVAKAKAPREWRAAIGEYGLGGFSHNLFTDRRVAHLVRLIREQPAGWFPSWPAELCIRALRCRPKAAPQSRTGAGLLGLGPFAATAARTSALRQAPLARPHLQPGALPDRRRLQHREPGRAYGRTSRPISPTTCAICERSSTWPIWERAASSSAVGKAATRCRTITTTSCRSVRGREHRDPLAAR